MTLIAVLFAGQAFASTSWNRTASRWTRLSGKVLVDSDGKTIGSVSDAILDSAGKVRYLIISEGGLLGMGERLVPIPIYSVQSTKNNRLIANVTRDRIENQPFFYASDWTWMDFNDDQLQKQVRDYYGTAADQP